ncbi:outer membrane protein assembly factor BamD [Bordetella genomosp. 11]|uniref:Outer membrane protein assembly factor BamD n=1 Tax=Bordetella genomosp. 11 TaxID=1416808 RepID=A0A261UQD4_9BORD|nr:outer membrane protein assembly factor BamD [Bordetella genomosp. 11]
MTVVTPRVPASPFAALRLGSVARLCLALAFTALLAACGTSGAKYDKTANWSAEQLYNDAKQEMDAGNWKDARERLTAVESRYPFGVYAQQALINLAYVNWKDGENDQALAAIDRFQQLYPNHPGTDYVLYLKGLINFTPASAFMTNITGQDPSERDPKGLRASYDAFNELIKRYPDSKYAADARLRVVWLVNAIAMNEVHVARYYYERGAYVAAANRAQTVITDFQGAPASEEALYILYKSYEKLKMPKLEADARRVLNTNFPNSTYPTQGFKKDKNWWDPWGWM